MKYYTRKRFLYIWSRFKWLIILYLFFVILWVFIKFNTERSACFAEKYLKFSKQFFLGWFPSFSEDLLFFGTAFLGLIITTKFLRDEPFDIRITSLANGENMNANVEAYIKNKIETLLSFNTDYKTTIHVQKTDESGQYIFVHVKFETRVVNMCEDQKIPASVPIYIEPGEKIDGTFGQIYSLFITHEVSKQYQANYKLSPPTIYVIKKGYNFDLNLLDGNPYDKVRDVPIHENSAVNVFTTFGIWVNIDGNHKNINHWFFNMVNGYTQNYSLTIQNDLDRDIFIALKYKDRLLNLFEPDEKLIKNQKIQKNSLQAILSRLIFLKEDRVELFFTLKEKEDFQ